MVLLPADKYGFIKDASSFVSPVYIVLLSFDLLATPIITTVTPALYFALLLHLKEVYAKRISCPLFNISGYKIPTCSPWHMLLVLTKAY